MELSARAVELFEQLGDKQGLTLACAEYCAAAALAKADLNLDRPLAQAMEMAQQLDRPRILAYVLEIQTITFFSCGEYAKARALVERVSALYESLGDQMQVANQFARLAECEFATTGDVARALLLAEHAYALYANRDDARPSRLWCLGNLANYNLIAGKFHEAYRLACEGVLLSQATASDYMFLCNLECLAATLAEFGDLRRAARMIGYTGSRMRQMNRRHFPTEEAVFEIAVNRLRSALSSDEFDRLVSEGATIGQEMMLAEIDAAIAAGPGGKPA